MFSLTSGSKIVIETVSLVIGILIPVVVSRTLGKKEGASLALSFFVRNIYAIIAMILIILTFILWQTELKELLF